MGAAASADPTRPKCLRVTCCFARHTEQSHGFCCAACQTNGTHGPACQRHIVSAAAECFGSTESRLELAGGIKLMEFKVKGSKPGRQFSAEISVLGGGASAAVSVAAQFAKQEHLPTDWKHYSVYAASVVFEYHNDQGPEFNIHLDPTVGVRLFGEDVLPGAVLLGSDWAPDNHGWKLLREHGNLHWQGKYAMSTPMPLEKGSHFRLLEFRVRGSSPGRRFSVYLEFQDPKGRRMGELTLLSQIALPLEMAYYSFDVEKLALTYHNDEGVEFNIYLDPAMGVRLLGEDVLPSAVIRRDWAPDNHRWKLIREHGELCWKGTYEMRPVKRVLETSERRWKCLRRECQYAKHTRHDVAGDYCCPECPRDGSHGLLCQQHPPHFVLPAADRVALKWQPSLLFGKDAMGHRVDETGSSVTEVMHIVPHKGELFAGLGRWMCRDYVEWSEEGKPYKPLQSPVMRLSSATGEWVEDLRGQEAAQHAVRITCVNSIKWTRDCHGQEVNPPVEQLACLFDMGKGGNIIMFRDDFDDSAPGTQYRWRGANYTGPMPELTNAGAAARAFMVHRDSVTGVDRIVALQGTLGVITGVYDPDSTAPGRVIWDKEPEKLDLSQIGRGEATRLDFRPLSLVVANGKAFLSGASLILQRVDGPNPVWKAILDIAKLRSGDGELSDKVGGIRGMTAVPCPSDPKQESILFCWNPNIRSKSWILRADPSEDGLKEPVEEINIRQLFNQYMGLRYEGYTVAAYNDMLPTSLGGRPCHLIGFEVRMDVYDVFNLGGPESAGLDPGQMRNLVGQWL